MYIFITLFWRWWQLRDSSCYSYDPFQKIIILNSFPRKFRVTLVKNHCLKVQTRTLNRGTFTTRYTILDEFEKITIQCTECEENLTTFSKKKKTVLLLISKKTIENPFFFFILFIDIISCNNQTGKNIEDLVFLIFNAASGRNEISNRSFINYLIVVIKKSTRFTSVIFEEIVIL